MCHRPPRRPDCHRGIRCSRQRDRYPHLSDVQGARADGGFRVKPEHETQVEDADAAHAILRGLGYAPTIAFEKRCRNYSFQLDGRDFLATLVQVPQSQGTFIELETQTEQEEPAEALGAVQAVLAALGIGESDLTTEQYTDAVAATR
ncbi:adenylate cyclase class IV [Kitasatospora sp. MAP12-15]|uniref:CYTH domain-containing protein n=1 Tax=unclassified Kitasatospora TaxID=2633591 RepID=UPI0024736AB9|nr:CYTH domain-containing protein [Kitasatospora sp. MAP12-44]MDH6114811.1 adenylate cyclase class IV [Kitasatospora sp. MAP12-44]